MVRSTANLSSSYNFGMFHKIDRNVYFINKTMATLHDNAICNVCMVVPSSRLHPGCEVEILERVAIHYTWLRGS